MVAVHEIIALLGRLAEPMGRAEAARSNARRRLRNQRARRKQSGNSGEDRPAVHDRQPPWRGVYFPLSLTPSRPANSCVNCQATRPEREPRVVDHSSASRSSSS